MEKFIMAGDCAIRVDDTGKGDITILLLHGYLESIEVWDSFRKLLKGYRTVAIDLPGHGISEVKGETHSMNYLAQVVRDALIALSIERCVIVGHSMGGYVALEFLDSYPQMVSGIVLFHSTPYADSEEKKSKRKQEIELITQGKKELIARTNPEGRFAEMNRKKFVDQIEELSDQVVLTEDAGAIAILNGMAARRDTNDVLQKSSIPQLFILGRYDDYIPTQIAEKMIADHTQAKVVLLQDSGHMGFIEEPNTSVEAIIEFISNTK